MSEPLTKTKFLANETDLLCNVLLAKEQRAQVLSLHVVPPRFLNLTLLCIFLTLFVRFSLNSRENTSLCNLMKLLSTDCHVRFNVTHTSKGLCVSHDSLMLYASNDDSEFDEP